MQLKTLVVDSNQIVRADWHLSSPMWQLLRGLTSTGQIRLVVPEIVVSEVVGVFKRALLDVKQELKRLHVPFDVDTTVATYDRELRLVLTTCGAAIPPDDHVSVPQLVQRATSRTMPFDKNGNGFRDTILWTRVLDLASNGQDVVFITQDQDFLKERDQAQGKQQQGNRQKKANQPRPEDWYLHPDLTAEAEGVGRLEWFFDISTYVAAHTEGNELSSIGTEVLELFNSDSMTLQTYIADAIVRAPVAVGGRDGVSAQITSIFFPLKLAVVAVAPLADQPDQFAVMIRVSTKVRLRVDVSTGETTSTTEAGIVVYSDNFNVGVIYDTTKKRIDQYSGNLVDMEWSIIVDSYLSQNDVRSSGASSELGTENWERPADSPVMRVLAGVSPSDLESEGSEDFELGRSDLDALTRVR